LSRPDVSRATSRTVRLVWKATLAIFRGFVVADDRARIVQLDRLNSRLLRHLSRFRFQAGDASAREDTAARCEQFDGLQKVVGHDGHHDIEFKIAVAAAERDAASLPRTCAQTWRSISHMTGLTLPGMIEEPGWVEGSFNSPRPRRGPEPRNGCHWRF